MKTLFWRVRFTISVVWIFRDFRGFHISLGWRCSKNTKYKHLPPYQAALEEIGDWYT